MATNSFIHTANVLATRPDRSAAAYACLTSSVNASDPIPNAPPAIARPSLPFLFEFGIPLGLVPYPLSSLIVRPSGPCPKHRLQVHGATIVLPKFGIGEKLNPFIALTRSHLALSCRGKEQCYKHIMKRRGVVEDSRSEMCIKCPMMSPWARHPCQ